MNYRVLIAGSAAVTAIAALLFLAGRPAVSPLTPASTPAAGDPGAPEQPTPALSPAVALSTPPDAPPERPSLPVGEPTAASETARQSAVILASPPPPPPPPVIDYPPLFGAREIRGANFAPFPKWTGLIERQVNEQALYDGPCSARRFNRCHLNEWRAMLKNVQALDRRAQIEAVNQFMNRAPYIVDPVNYRVSDYWATPLQFLTKDGDCEDYAIAKYISLRELGFPTELLRIVVLDDLNLGIAHAVLAVYLDGEAFILDNQISHVIAAAKIRHYRPIYSINEEYWWLHRPPTQ